MPRKHRQRYTVMTTTSKVVVLAYSEQDARSWALVAKGLTPTGVTKGDYRLSGNPNKGWTLDEAALRRAQSLLGLQ